MSHRLIVPTTALLGLTAVFVTAAVSPRVLPVPTAVQPPTLSAMVLVISVDGTTRHMGSGVLTEVAGRLVVLTACHVVDGRDEVLLIFPRRDASCGYVVDADYYLNQVDRFAVRGRVAHRQADRDLALIEPETVPDGAHPLPLASGTPSSGARVQVVGNALDASRSLWRYREGEVVRIGARRIKARNGDRFHAEVIEVGVPTGHGDSGGPILNENGEIVGIISGAGAAGIVAIQVSSEHPLGA